MEDPRDGPVNDAEMARYMELESRFTRDITFMKRKVREVLPETIVGRLEDDPKAPGDDMLWYFYMPDRPPLVSVMYDPPGYTANFDGKIGEHLASEQAAAFIIDSLLPDA